MDTKQEKSCGAVVFRRMGNNEQVLLIRHKNNTVWSFPKGHMEQGETEPATALREIKEETGLTVQLDMGFRQTVDYFVRANVQKEVVFFVAGPLVNSPPLMEDDIVQEAKWFDVQEAPHMLHFSNHRELFERALAYYRQSVLYHTDYSF